MNMLADFTKGLIKDNPVFVGLLGMCSTLAITTSLANALGMGLAVTAVLTMANVVISLMRKIIPHDIRIPVFIIVIAGFVTIIEMVMEAYVPQIYRSLGIFLPLIVVNCIILARAESFASKNGVLLSMLDGLGMGLGYTIAICSISLFREIIGAGSILGLPLLGESYQPALIMILPPGAFITLACILAFLNKLESRKAS